MTLSSPPNKIQEAADALIACAAASTLGCGSLTAYWYPTAGLKTTALPFCVLEEASYQAERHAPGESYARGEVLATYYLDPGTIETGAAESACRDLVHQLVELTGANLFITGGNRTLASKVRRSKVAAGVDGAARSYFTIQVSITWEG